jgi:hypothetical protein
VRISSFPVIGNAAYFPGLDRKSREIRAFPSSHGAVMANGPEDKIRGANIFDLADRP